MILADSSAWIEYLRGTGTRPGQRVARGLRSDEIMTTDVVVMEILAGAGSDQRHEELRRMFAAIDYTPTVAPGDYETAANLYRRCRAAGEAPRHVNDCLIAAVAIRGDVPVLHRDRDFDRIARHSALQVDAASGTVSSRRARRP